MKGIDTYLWIKSFLHFVSKNQCDKKMLKDIDVFSNLQNHCQICHAITSEAKETPDLDNENFLTILS